MDRKGQRRWVFYYDGQCRFCTRTVKILAALDFLRQLTWKPFQDLEAPPGHLTWEDLDREAYLATGAIENLGDCSGHLYGGFYAFRMLSLRLLPLMPLVPLLWLPGVNRLGEVTYRWVACNRYRFRGPGRRSGG